jgi:hypothetical protein
LWFFPSNDLTYLINQTVVNIAADFGIIITNQHGTFESKFRYAMINRHYLNGGSFRWTLPLNSTQLDVPSVPWWFDCVLETRFSWKMVFLWRGCMKVDEDEEMVVSEGVLTIYRFRPSLMPRNVERSNDLSVVCATDV